MAKYDTEKKKRDSAERKRTAAQKVIDNPKSSPKSIEKAKERRSDAAQDMRDAGEEMRDITGRERGEGTRYLGPSTAAIRKEKTGTGDQTKYQEYNIGILGALGGDREYYKEIWTPEMQEYWATHGKLPPGTVKKPVKKLPPRDKNLLEGYEVFEGDTGDNLLSSAGKKGRGWQVGGPGGPAGETDYLAYRPGSEAYWRSYMGPKLTGSLMRMKQPAVTQASLAYLPGEIRDPAAWGDFLGMGGKLRGYYTDESAYDLRSASPDKQFQGLVPQGTWRRGVKSYPTGKDYPYSRKGWEFAAAPSQMIAQPAWTAYDISPQAAAEWTGLLGDWAAPALNTTNLLGVA